MCLVRIVSTWPFRFLSRYTSRRHHSAVAKSSGFVLVVTAGKVLSGVNAPSLLTTGFDLRGLLIILKPPLDLKLSHWSGEGPGWTPKNPAPVGLLGCSQETP